MREAGVILSFAQTPLFWHVPEGRTAGQIPDSFTLWEFFQSRCDEIYGFAHTHPGSGVPTPSQEDITTFTAIERALNRRFHWWIVSADEVVTVVRSAHGSEYEYTQYPVIVDAYVHEMWLDELRRRST